MGSTLLPPANEVYEGYVFTDVGGSLSGGSLQGGLCPGGGICPAARILLECILVDHRCIMFIWEVNL